MDIDIHRTVYEIIPISDLVYTLLAFLIIISLIILTRFLNKIHAWQEEWSRKLVHITVGSMAAFAPMLFKSSHFLIFIAAIFGTINFIAIKKNYLKGIHGHRHSYGTVYFPIAYVILIKFCWLEHRHLITLGILLFAVPDALAALVGQSIKSIWFFTPIRDRKSIPGSLTMFAFSFIIILSFGILYLNHEILIIILISLILAIIISVVEMLSSLGSDNLFVPISGALSFYIFQYAEDTILVHLALGTGLAMVVSFLSFRMKFLSLSGSLMTFLLATSIFGLGGVKWAIPILSFFILSSILSKAGKGIKSKYKDTFEKSGVRDYAQVIANGGIGGLLVIYNYFYASDIIYLLYLVSLSVSTSDTWATEIGILFKWKPFMVTTFKKVEPGISGAISLHGTLGGFIGSLIVVSSGIIFLNQISTPIIYLIFISFFGTVGSLLDSIMGAAIQGQYQCLVCEKYTEKKIHCLKKTQQIRGLNFLNNDLVNLFSSAITVAIFFFLVYQ